MRDVIFKLRILALMLRDTFEGWKMSIWQRDLDGHYCCDGRECGCQGSSVRDVYNWEIRR